MTTGAPSPPFIFQGFTGNGALNAFGFVATYQAGTTTPIATYTDATLTTPNQNPVPLNAIGQAPIWLKPGLAYKFVETDSGGNQCGYADNVPGFITGPYLTALLTASYIGGLLYPQTTQETAAGVTPAFYQYPPGDIRRYGAATTLADNTAAINTANSIGITLTIPQGVFKFTGNPIITSPLVFSGGVLQPVANISINGAINAPTQQIFNCSLGGTITGKFKAEIYPVEWWGATGNTISGGAGVTYYASTVFTDGSADFQPTDVNKTLVIIPPIYSQLPAVITTIAEYVNANEIALGEIPPWMSQCSFSGTISNGGGSAGTTLTVLSSPAPQGTIYQGMTFGSGASGTILYQLTGTTGGAGTYKVGTSQYVGTSTPMTCSSPLSYFYGTDDTNAINAANASVGQLSQVTGIYQSGSDELSFAGDCIYLMSNTAVISGPSGGSAGTWKGQGGMSTIVFAIASSTTDCVHFGVNGPRSFSKVENLTFNGCLSGQDLFVFAGFQSPSIRNVYGLYACRDCLSITPQANNYIQQGHVENTYWWFSGRHNIYVNPEYGGASCFVNELDFVDLVTQYPSCRQVNGTAICIGGQVPFGASGGATANTGSMSSWTIMNWKCSTGLNGDPNYAPYGSFFCYNGSNSNFAEVGIRFIGGYAENGAPGSALAPFAWAPGVGINLSVSGFYASNWGSSISHADFNAASEFTVAPGASQTLVKFTGYYGGAVELVCKVTDTTASPNGVDYFRLSVTGGGSGVSQTSPIMAGPTGNTGALVGERSTYSTIPTYTITTSNSGGNFTITFNNTSGTNTETISYVAKTLDMGNCPVYYV